MMTKITFQAKSSGETPYAVDFIIEGGMLTVRCNCKAGIYHNLCKHVKEPIAGNESRLFDLSQAEELDRIKTRIINTEIVETAAELAAVERTILREQGKKASLKKRFESLLESGIKVAEQDQS